MKKIERKRERKEEIRKERKERKKERKKRKKEKERKERKDNFLDVKLTLKTVKGTLWDPSIPLDVSTTVRPKKKLFVSCNPTLTSFYSKKSLP